MFKKVEKLFETATRLNYDERCGMKMVEAMRGPGFFPGCNGLHDSGTAAIDRYIMVVGQDFDTEINYLKLGDDGEVNSNTTWRNLKKLLKDIDIQESHCFFTNVYMGLRKDAEKNTGPSPAKKSPAFVGQCQGFFKVQLAIINPSVVLVLGKEPAKFIAEMFEQNFQRWQEIRQLKLFYQHEENLVCNLLFEEKSIKFLFVLHPSMSNTNRAKIWGKGLQKETELLRKHLHNNTLPN